MEPFDLQRRISAAAALAVLILGGCGGPQKGAADAAGQFAGLDGEILKWRAEIVKEGRLCQSQAEGQKCNAFEVACKAERTVTAADQAKGVTARVVAAIDWNGWDPKLKQAQAGSEVAEFTKTGPAWTRTVHRPVNMSTCADL
jgi:hypothetical protein